MRKYLLFFFFLFLAANLYSQTLEWVNTYGSAGRDRGQCVVLDAQNNIYSTGSFGGGQLILILEMGQPYLQVMEVLIAISKNWTLMATYYG